jgi:aryl-phospho-beta-D-glucosidase BglC (GH1 family)
MKSMLKTKGRKIVDEKGREVVLRSIGIGGWLMMEGYMLGGKNIPEHVFKARLAGSYGNKRVIKFTQEYQRHFFNEADVARIKKLGFNCARLPVNHRVFDQKNGFKLLDETIKWFRKYKVYLVLDLHAAPGAQNQDWHSDSDGVAGLWENDKNIDRTVALWDRVSKRYKNENIIAGYDILNEAVTKKVSKVNRLYSRIISAIRSNGDKHIIFIEPNMWAANFDGIKKPKDDNFAWSIHFYQPINFTFNWDPLLKCPSEKEIAGYLKQYRDIQLRDNVPVFIGEFGVSSRCHECHAELKWVEHTLSIFREFGWSWSYWTYKSVAGMLAPDGLYQTFDHEIFRRDSATPGMENIQKILGYAGSKLYNALETKNFKLHETLQRTLLCDHR